jgi:hypothetical protein
MSRGREEDGGLVLIGQRPDLREMMAGTETRGWPNSTTRLLQNLYTRMTTRFSIQCNFAAELHREHSTMIAV